MKKATLILLLALGGLLALALGFVLRDLVGAYLVKPILFIAWLVQLVLNSIPGWLWWSWFLIIAFIVALRSLRLREEATERPDAGRWPVAGPVQVWADRLRTARHSDDYFRWHLARDLTGVSMDLARLLAYRYTYDEQHGETAQKRAEDLAVLNAPPAVAAYLRVGLAAPPAQPIRRFARIPRPWQPQKDLSPLDLDPQEVVAFLEGQLEKKHDA